MMIQTRDNTFAYLLHDVTRLMRKHFDRRATRLQLTRAQWRALKVIRRHEGLSQTELADYLDMEPIPVGRVIDRLEKAGMVVRGSNPEDRRSILITVTDDAEHAIASTYEVFEARLAGLMEDLSPDERRDVISFFSSLADAADATAELSPAR